MKRETKKSAGEKGQAILPVVLALSLFLAGALGLAIDVSQMYAQRQMAQAAADAAAGAGIMSILDNTNTSADSNAFGTSSFTCASGSALTPCYYANLNGFGAAHGDTVKVVFPASVAGVVGLATIRSPNLISVAVTRTVPTTLIHFLSASGGTITAHATAAILLPPLAIPIIVTHPTLAGAFQMSGDATIKITNGPSVGIQVNSCAGRNGTGSNGLACQSGNAIQTSGGNGTSCSATCVDLSTAGPSGGAGSFGNWGAPATWSAAGNGYLNPASGYISPSSPQSDPLSTVAAPVTTGRPAITNVTPSANSSAPNPCIVKVTAAGGLPASPNPCQGSNTYGCPGSATNSKGQCSLYYPGVYSAAAAPIGISLSGGAWALFAPGLYYLAKGDGSSLGLQLSGGASATMATGLAASAETGTGLTFFLTGNAVVNLSGGSSVVLLGDTLGTTFGGMLFFKDRTDAGGRHTLSGGAGLSLTGTIYMTKNNLATNAGGGYNVLNMSGGSGSTTTLNGEVIADTMNLSGGAKIVMNLGGTARDVMQVALVQ